MIQRGINKLILLLTISITCYGFSFGQEQQECIPVYEIQYPDSNYMKQYVNKRFWILKDGLKDGKWVAYYDKARKDTAMIATVKGGLVNGWVKRWDEDTEYLARQVEYKDGKMDGLWIDYFKTPEGKTLINIYVYEGYTQQRVIQQEF